MATTRKYLNHLLQTVGITPACSEEERLAAEQLAEVFRKHGFQPEIQEFSASGRPRQIRAALGVLVFVGALLAGFGGVAGAVGVLLTLVAAALYVLERQGVISFSLFGGAGYSQNVVAYHKAAGPLASPRNRPVVVVAHYDSPRADLFSQFPYAAYKPTITKLLPYLMVAPAVIAVVRLLPVPGALKVVLWLAALACALVPLANAVGVIANQFVLPYTTGSVCNKSSVAALLGVMDAVAPYGEGEEFPDDVPFEEYFAEQRRQAEAAEVEAAVAAGDLPEEALEEQDEDTDEPEESVEAEGVEEDGQEELGEEAEVDTTVAPVSLDATMAGTSAISAEALAAAGVAAVGAAGATAQVPALGATGVIPSATATMPAIEVEAASPAAADPVSETTTMPALTDELATGVEEIEAAETAVEQEASAEGAMPVVEVIDEAIGVESETEGDPETEETLTEAADVAESAVEGEPVEGAPAPSEPVQPCFMTASGTYRYGVDIIRAIGMVPADCEIEYHLTEPEPVAATTDEVEEPAEVIVPVEPVADTAAEVVSEAMGLAVEVPIEEAAPAEGVASIEEYDDYADAYADDPYTDDEFGAYDEYAEDEEYQPLPARTGASMPAGLNETLSTARESASRFFDAALRRGKSMFESVTAQISSHHTDTDGEGTAEQAEPAAVDAASADLAPDVEASVEGASVSEDAQVTSDESAPVEDEAAAETCTDAPEAIAVGKTVSTPVLTDDMVPDEIVPAAELGPEDVAPVPTAAPAPVSTAHVDDLEATVARTITFQSAPAAPTPAPSPAAPEPETIDSLMAQITARPVQARPAPRPVNRAFSMVPDPSAPSVNQMEASNRASLFDVPDPSSAPVDPLASEVAQNETPRPAFTVVTSSEAVPQVSESPFETIASDVPAAPAPRPRKKEGKRGRGLFGRKKKQEDSMSDWLGVDDNFDAKSSGRDIGSWDNFEDDDWKGGATGPAGTPIGDLRDAVTSMGDDELLGHDIWFVATGASELGGAGIQEFLNAHRDKLRGVFLINLESIGAGEPAVLACEGGVDGAPVLKGDKRIMGLVQRVSAAFHHEFAAVDMPYITTDAYRAMEMRLRALTIAGVEGDQLACSHTTDDAPHRVRERNTRLVSDVVTEVIRRS